MRGLSNVHCFASTLAKARTIEVFKGPEVGGGNFIADTWPRTVPPNYVLFLLSTTQRKHADSWILEVLRGITMRFAMLSLRREQAAVESLSTITADDEATPSPLTVSVKAIGVAYHQRIASQVGVIHCRRPAVMVLLPARGIEPAACRYRIIVDPIDGTRGIMYQKRSAWIFDWGCKEQGY